MRPYTVVFCVVLLVAAGYVATLSSAFADPTIAAFSVFGHPIQPPAPSAAQILLTGDVMLARDVERKFGMWGHAYPFSFMHDVFSAHDIVVSNFEGSVPELHRPTPDLTYTFSVRSDVLDELRGVGFTHMSLANNHSYDFGRAGFAHTIEKLEDAGIEAFGDPYRIRGNSLTTIEMQSATAALIALDLTVGDYDRDALDELFARARASSDVQIVYVHWGTEYRPRHSAEQERWARYFVAAGVDLIVGHHPHVVQGVGEIDGVPVFYSLGNFIFDQYFSREVQEGLVLSISMPERTIELIPVTSEHTLIAPQLMDDSSTKQFLTDLANRSDEALSEDIEVGVISF